ncbi:hypothetical protein LTR36_007130 [Oleoguttula mirabilis]|uniref:Indoleamine 2,3-dioxygenase n=1 Tax=Oleoguttula mirabilis TaxID=1507867 RepID=A0AAV9JAP8_9PEZI|nr:hypothetical protein LTR36_007130 [Oleoguttula mirabilis]
MSPYLSHDFASSGSEQKTLTMQAAPHLDADPAVLPSSLDPFTVTTSTGFMPLHTPVVDLPAAFNALTTLAENMPIVKLDGTPGLLAQYQLGPTVDGGALPDLSHEIDKLVAADGEPDLAAITAAFRDYAFLASAYLLEPCWERQNKGLEGYGLGRAVLPKCLAGPLVKTAKMLDIPPFMSYAAAYSLYNYRFADPAIGHDAYSNLRLIRAFECGLDPASSEAGFVLTHVDMVKHSAGLVKGAAQLLNAVAAPDSPAQPILDAFDLLLETMTVVEASMESMWQHSKPKDYLSYRTFIFGITNQSMFPAGVVYEGQHDDTPLFFRGESGANDSMIPLLDALLQIPMPANPLTEILKDFRSYRPKPHREFLAVVRERAEAVGVKEEYIIRRSSHPTATGGSPIVTWLPNQLLAVMDLQRAVWEGVDGAAREGVSRDVVEMMEGVEEQRGKLQREVERWCQERGAGA